MAEQKNKSVVAGAVDKIRAYMGQPGMKPAEIQKFQAAVSIIPCDSSAKCWELLACQKEISLPVIDREMIEVDSSDACRIFEEGSAGTWKQYVPDTVRFMGEWTQELYYRSDRIDLLLEASGKTIPYIVLIEVADERRTQFAFLAHLKTVSSDFASTQDSAVTVIPTTWQPTGQPMLTYGVDINYCEEQEGDYGLSSNNFKAGVLQF